jgi:hypothetical protein
MIAFVSNRTQLSVTKPQIGDLVFCRRQAFGHRRWPVSVPSLDRFALGCLGGCLGNQLECIREPLRGGLLEPPYLVLVLCAKA